jgi:hypothetical protein
VVDFCSMSRLVAVCARRYGSLPAPQATAARWYSSTRPALEEEAAVAKKDDNKQLNKQVAREFGRRKAAYKRHVGELRKEYLGEYLKHKAEDEAARETEQAEATRKRLERQRSKNERSAENAVRQAELRRQTHLAFQDHLQQMQEKRDAKNKLFTRAQQLIIGELEEEAPFWMTTPEEVDAVFTHEAEQLLWARPNGILGAPNPSDDSHFWQYEAHTWQMKKTYKTQRDILLEELEQEAYNKANIDPNFWTPEKLEQQEELERKARLRALVRLEGRRALLKRQMEFLDEEAISEDGEPPKPAPVPSLAVLSDVSAQEKEGAELLFKDPTKFFIFDRNHAANSGDDDSDEAYSGGTLGVPVALRDPLRTGEPQGRVFPQGIGKMPKPDTRTEKEKKRQEREEKLWAAAQAQARSDQDEIDLAADEDMEQGEPLDYDANDDWDSDDEEWVKGLDPDTDADIINTPREFRYREEDVEWVIEQLENKASQIQSHVRNSLSVMQQELRAKKERREKEKQTQSILATEDAQEATEDDQQSPFLDDAAVQKLERVGADVQKLESVLSSLSEGQLIALFSLGLKGVESTDVMEHKSPEDIASDMQQVPGLTQEQIATLVDLETKLQQVEKSSEEEV